MSVASIPVRGAQRGNSLRILGINYPVQFVTPNIGRDEAPLGECHTGGTTIIINAGDNSDEHQKSVVLHEIIEALNYRMELKLKHRQISQLEAGLFSVLVENPWLLDWMRE